MSLRPGTWPDLTWPYRPRGVLHQSALWTVWDSSTSIQPNHHLRHSHFSSEGTYWFKQTSSPTQSNCTIYPTHQNSYASKDQISELALYIEFKNFHFKAVIHLLTLYTLIYWACPGLISDLKVVQWIISKVLTDIYISIHSQITYSTSQFWFQNTAWGKQKGSPRQRSKTCDFLRGSKKKKEKVGDKGSVRHWTKPEGNSYSTL